MRAPEILDHEEEHQDAHRPRVLTALCILTWIGSISIIVMAIVKWLEMSSEDSAGLQGLHVMLAIAGSVLTFTGAALMWMLRSAGFWIYVIGEMLPMITFAMIIYRYQVADDTFSWLKVGSNILVNIGFIAMYARFYKIFR